MTDTTRWRALADQLAASVADGTYPIGSRMPSISALMAETGLSTTTVRSALRWLRDQGILATEPSVGSVVVAVPALSLPDRVAALEAWRAEVEAWRAEIKGDPVTPS